jgi:tetratricopeptide (TPR) repeat protein
LPLKPIEEIADWLISRTDDVKARIRIAKVHYNIGFAAYTQGDSNSAMKHLAAAFRFQPDWHAANGLAYISFTTGARTEACGWIEQAVALATNAAERSLSLYNEAIFHLKDSDFLQAHNRLIAAGREMSYTLMSDGKGAIISVLRVPELEDGQVQVFERANIRLDEAIAKATEIAEFLEKYDKIRRSSTSHTMLGGSESNRPASS